MLTQLTGSQAPLQGLTSAWNMRTVDSGIIKALKSVSIEFPDRPRFNAGKMKLSTGHLIKNMKKNFGFYK